MSNQELPSFIEIEIILSNLHLDIGAAELHGALCANACATGNDNAEQALIAAIQWDEGKLPPMDPVLIQLFNVSFNCLITLDFEFELLVPDDDSSLLLRVEQLSRWCQGFMANLAMAGVNIEYLARDDDTKEVLKDFVQIASMDASAIAIDDDEEGEKAYVEIIEYVRMAVLMISCELASQRRHAHRNPNSEEIH